MGKLTFGTVDGFGADIGSRSQRVSIGFTLEDIDTSIDPVAIAGFVKNYTAAQDVNNVGMYAMGSECPDPEFEDCLLSNILIEGLTFNAVRGRAIFSTADLGFTPSVYLVTRTRQIIQHTENILPNGVIIEADKKDSSGNVICRDLVPMTFRRSSPVVIVEGLRAGEPDYAGADYIGYVNEGTWRGRPTGHWFIDDFTTQWSRYTGYHQFRTVTVANILDRDWSSYGTLFNSLVGKYVKVEQDDIDAAMATSYNYGIIFASLGTGIVRVGGYPTVSFPSIGMPV